MGIASMRHPVSGATYTDRDGRVEVLAGGRRGLFTRTGQWIEGELRQADPHMCLWIAGHAFGDSVPFRNQRLQENHGVGVRAQPRDGGRAP